MTSRSCVSDSSFSSSSTDSRATASFTTSNYTSRLSSVTFRNYNAHSLISNIAVKWNINIHRGACNYLTSASYPPLTSISFLSSLLGIHSASPPVTSFHILPNLRSTFHSSCKARLHASESACLMQRDSPLTVSASAILPRVFCALISTLSSSLSM